VQVLIIICILCYQNNGNNIVGSHMINEDCSIICNLNFCSIFSQKK
jgi:hypothetical protein